MFDFTSYLFLPDQSFVIFLHRWFDVSLWYVIYPLAMLHSSAWVLVKVGIFRGAAVLVQRRAARRQATPVKRVRRDTWLRPFFRRVRYLIVTLARNLYVSAKRIAHGKVVDGYSLFWIALTPLLQKLGDAIVGIRWQQFRWRGVTALCLGASVQSACFCVLYSIYGKDRAERIMLWTMLPLGIIMLLTWLFKNGRTKST